MSKKSWRMLAFAAGILGSPAFLQATEKSRPNIQVDELRSVAPHVYLDCSPRVCDLDYVRKEVTFVNYVRDRQSADIHILVTRQATASGGNEYTLDFIGQKKYQGRDSTLKYFSKPTDTEDQVRKGMVNVLKQGLIPYVSDTPLAEFISVIYERKPETRLVPGKDIWDYWVFSTGLRGNANVEQLFKRLSYSLSLSANRTTEEMKFRLWANGNFDERRYQISEEEEIVSQSNRKFMFTQYVKSINDHWSVGASLSLFSSTFDNADLYASLGPAVEYDIFPYEESTRRELRIQYRLNFSRRNYIETTIFDKDREDLFSQVLQVILEVKEPWGSMGMQLEGSNFLHDFSKNNLKAEAGLSLKVFKGLSLDIGGSYSRVRDQIYLSGKGASKEEILLELKRLATTYSLRFEMGFNYRFGSIYSNVVNPRFGNR